MYLFNVILIIIIIGFAMFGLWFGLIHTLGSFIGTIFGAYIASRMYGPIAVWLVHITGWHSNVANVVAFIFLFIIINRIIGLLFWFVDRLTSFFTRMPFLRSLNRLLGIILGTFEGIITVGLIIYFIQKYPLSNQIMSWINTSSIASWTQNMSAFLIPLLPKALRILQTTIHAASGGQINLPIN